MATVDLPTLLLADVIASEFSCLSTIEKWIFVRSTRNCSEMAADGIAMVMAALWGDV
jgi:hypothetical protein